MTQFRCGWLRLGWRGRGQSFWPWDGLQVLQVGRGNELTGSLALATGATGDSTGADVRQIDVDSYGGW